MQLNSLSTKSFAVGAALVLALAGCGSNSSSATSESSSAASSSPNSSSEVVQQESKTAWNNVGSAEEAAKGAGLDKFGVIGTITIDGKEFKDPTFAYADGVAQATYTTDGVSLIVRKGADKHTAPMTDRDTTSFASKWQKSFEGLDVNLYGVAKGAATVLTWNDSSLDYGVTYQGANDQDVTMDSDEAQAIVNGMKHANEAEPENTEEQAAQSSSSEQPAQSGSSEQQSGEQPAQSGSSEQSQGGTSASSQSMELARTNALASTGMSGAAQNVTVSWQGDHWLVSFNSDNTFFEVDVDTEGVVLAEREYQNGVEVIYGQNNEGVLNQDEIDAAGAGQLVDDAEDPDFNSSSEQQ